MKYKTQKEKNSKLELEITIDNKDFIKYWDKAFKAVQENIEMDGFRKGHAPQNIITAKYGEAIILEEMANLAINQTYPEIIIKEKIKVISAPHIHVINLNKDQDFVYHAHVEIYPEIKDFEYKNIIDQILADKKQIPETTEEEIKQVMESLSPEIIASHSKQGDSLTIEERIKENIKLEKEHTEKSRLRAIFLEKSVGTLKQKYQEDLPATWDDKLLSQFIILLISKSEAIKVEDMEVEMEMLKMLAGTNPQSIPNYNEENMKSYIKQIITNEKTLEKIGL